MFPRLTIFLGSLRSSQVVSKYNNLKYGIRAEATPYYIASAKACERIAATFNTTQDDYRLVMMVRDSTKRAWSEYQMEVRREGGYS